MVTNMKFESHIYSSKQYRPKPIYHFNEKAGLLITLTPWGSRQKIEPLLQNISDFIATYINDPEATTPFQRLAHLSLEANALNTAALVASKNLYTSLNESELHGGFELSALVIKDQVLTWIQSGHPHIILDRNNKSLLPLHIEVDFSSEFEEQNKLSPLPSHLLGVSESPYLNWGRMKLQPEDKIILLSRSWIPSELYQLRSADRSLNKIVNLIVNNDSEQPFWLGLFHTN